MQATVKDYDCAIIGGGLAGLCLAIQLAGQHIGVVLFEKNEYPFHKVCGEYVSMESWDFLERLGVPLTELNLPRINQLGISSEYGFMLDHELKMGGFGISRYSLDDHLSKIAVRKGVTLIQRCKVNAVTKAGDACHEIDTSQGLFRAEIVCGSYGKYTPSFILQDSLYGSSEKKSRHHYIGVKYHIKTDLAANRIELHNFTDGYCGISKVDRGWHCLCYLTKAENLQRHGKDIQQMEKEVLHKNPYLKHYFTTSEFISPQPLVISNIQFRRKQTSVQDIFLLGDAAGSITPLCGNGMSMGMRASVLLARGLAAYFKKERSRTEIVSAYNKSWNKAFSTRIVTGYYLQNLFGKRNTTDLSLKLLAGFPAVMDRLVSLTHGDKF